MVVTDTGSTLVATARWATPHTVDDIMSTSVETIRENDSLKTAIERFHLCGLRHLVVLDEGDRFVGVLTDRLAIDNGGYDRRNLWLPRVRDAVFDSRTYVLAGTTVVDAAREVLLHSAGALGVVDEDLRVMGVVTGADLLRALMARL